MASCPLFRLPRELRDLIYAHYLVVDGGLVCDTPAFLQGVFRTRDGRAPDIALAYTCRRLAHELDNGRLALTLNTITFTTLYSDDLSMLAHVFGDTFTAGLERLRVALLNSVAPYMPPAALDRVQAETACPRLVPLLRTLAAARSAPSRAENLNLTATRSGPYGEAPSVYHAFVKHALSVAADTPEAVPVIRAWLPPDWSETHTAHINKPYWFPHRIIENPTEPWDIPSPETLAQLQRLIPSSFGTSQFHAEVHCSKFRFSAAAAAIYFLQSASHDVLACLRSIVLLEDGEAVARPESHALGLIPFCRAYPGLRFERRLALWSNALLPDVRHETPSWRVGHGMPRRTPPLLHSDQITGNLAPWIMEATALATAGMPAGCFSLVLESGGAPELCTQIFDAVVHRDVAWQQAWVHCMENGISNVSWLYRKGEGNFRHGYPEWYARIDFQDVNTPADRAGFWGYFFEDFPEAVRDIVDGRSVVRCDFPAGAPWDVGQVIDRAKTWDPRTWEAEWFKHTPAQWETVPPLRKWQSILEDNIRATAKRVLPGPQGPRFL